MSDDIAHRLRVGEDRFLNIARMHEVLLEAADEIELLRKDCEFWEKRYWQLIAGVTP